MLSEPSVPNMSDAEISQPSCPSVADGSALIPAKRSWQYGIAPHYIGLFLWIVFADRLGRTTLPIGGLGWSMLGAIVAALLCNELLFKGPALWGQAADKTTIELAGRVFGTTGARLSGIVIGLGEIVWFAVATGCATELTLDGLVACGLLSENTLRPLVIGRTTFPPALFLLTSLFWSFAAALTATWLIRIIGALMNAYPIFPAVVFAVTMLMLLPNLRTFAPTGIDPIDGRYMPEGRGTLLTLLRMVQLIFGFFAMAGVLSADWGKASGSARDVRLGGWVGVVLAPTVVAAIALMTVAGYQGKVAPRFATDEVPEPGVVRRSTSRSTISEQEPAKPPTLLVRDAIKIGIGGRMSGAMLLVLGLASLAPAVYASFTYAHRFKEAVGGLSRIAWMLVATVFAWPLMATGLVANLEGVFFVMGAVFAPMAAAYSALASRDKRAWTGPRAGINPSGAIGWACGTVVGLLPLVAPEPVSRLQPAALWAFVTAYVVTRVFASLGWESRRIEPLTTTVDATS